MNKAITDGVQLMPPAFEQGLTVWSKEDGRPGQATYNGDPNATLIAADADFSGCLELFKTSSTQKLRYTGETPMLTGCYWRITARVKAISGPLPSVRIAAWAGTSGGAHVSGVTQTGPSTALTTYGEVIEVSAIVGSGTRTGVDMIWGSVPTFGHFGIDLTGADGGVVRIDDIVIEDVTSVFAETKLDIIDVRDYGAVGDGTTDNVAAFEAADAAAGGRTLLVPAGVYYLGTTLTIASEIRFLGTVSMPANARLELLQNFDYPTYFTAFGNEQTAFEKAVQALFNFSDHDSLDLAGRSITLTRPVDVQAVVGNKTSFSTRRVIRNGQLVSSNSTDWDDDQVSATATYDSGDPFTLSNVTNIETIAVGSLITASTGVGREVYVRAINTSANTITLSRQLYAAPTSQTYTFTRFKYQLDFHKFTYLARFVLENIEFGCTGRSSGIMLPENGLIFHVKDCFFTTPKDRGLTSIGNGCAGMMLDRCQWLSNEQPLAVSQRNSIGFNTNGNDIKIRDNRAIRFRHWGVCGGGGYTFNGNHFFQDDPTGGTIRTAGLVIAQNSPKHAMTGNYIDNCFIEWTNEFDATPQTGSFSFGSFSITGNIFTASEVDSWFTFLQVKPHGPGHFLNGVSITGNAFKVFGGAHIDRFDSVDDSIAPLDYDNFQNVTITGNTYTNVDMATMNPVTVGMTQTTATSIWRKNLANFLPFKGTARYATAVVPQGKILNGSSTQIYDQPYVAGQRGTGGQEIDVKWSQPVTGTVRLTVRCDDTF